ncbi:hypothetical protein [Flagellimonas flava]|uniref:hypothetical protein n=1 Tax=Flagellimonas flava TaxID=570519 RepID=UPI0013F4E073|nr:hypothetical protein [Allomuricauda flava]
MGNVTLLLSVIGNQWTDTPFELMDARFELTVDNFQLVVNNEQFIGFKIQEPRP